MLADDSSMAPIIQRLIKLLLDLEYPVTTTVVLLHDNDLHFNFNQKNAFTATAMSFSNLGSEYNLFVALTHIGYSQDKAVAEAVPEVDVIVGGHSHTLLEKAETVNGVLIAQAGGPPPQHQIDPDWPKYLGKIKVVFENETVVEKSGYVISICAPVTSE